MCVFACISMVIYVPETWRQTKTNKGQSIKSANGQGIFKPLPCSLSVAEMVPVAVIRSQGISKQINARNHARFNQFNPFRNFSPPSSGDGPLPSPPVQNLSRVRKPSLHVGLEAARLTVLKHGRILANPTTRWGFRLGQLYMVDFPASHV